MAHRLFEHDKQQGTSQGWHGKTEIREIITLDDNWLRDWDIVSQPLYYANEVPSGFSMLECSDNAEIKIGAPYNPETYKPISNADFLELVRASISGTEHKLVSVGSVRNRGRVFLSIELQGMEKFKAAGREFSAYLNFGNGHDKSSVLWTNTSNVCTVCDNTFSENLFRVEQKSITSQLAEDINIMLRHTKNASMRFPEIAKLIDAAVGVQAEFALAMDTLESTPCEKPMELFTGFLGRNTKEKPSTRARNTANRLMELYAHGAGNRGQNMADAFSAVTDYYSHESSRGDDVNKQILSSEYGAGATAKSEFWDIVRDEEARQETTEHGASLLALA